MGNGLEDVVELGFEGIDRFADKYHDKVYGFSQRRLSKSKNKNKNLQKSPRAQSEPPNDRDEHSDEENLRHSPRRDSMNSPDRNAYRDVGADAGWRPGEYYPSPPPPVNPDIGRTNQGYAAAAPYGYEVARQAPASRELSPPSGYAIRRFEDRHEDPYSPRGRRPPPLRRRSSSYSPPRRSHLPRFSSPPRQRKRSNSPNHHRVASTIVGALAGGFIGHSAKKGDTLATVAGAVIGGLGGREAERAWDRHQNREIDEEERRARRRRQRENQWR